MVQKADLHRILDQPMAERISKLLEHPLAGGGQPYDATRMSQYSSNCHGTAAHAIGLLDYIDRPTRISTFEMNILIHNKMREVSIIDPGHLVTFHLEKLTRPGEYYALPCHSAIALSDYGHIFHQPDTHLPFCIETVKDYCETYFMPKGQRFIMKAYELKR